MGTHPIFESDFDCLTECPSKSHVSFAKTTLAPAGGLTRPQLLTLTWGSLLSATVLCTTSCAPLPSPCLRSGATLPTTTQCSTVTVAPQKLSTPDVTGVATLAPPFSSSSFSAPPSSPRPRSAQTKSPDGLPKQKNCRSDTTSQNKKHSLCLVPNLFIDRL